MWIASAVPRSFINRSITIAECGLYVRIAPPTGHETRGTDKPQCSLALGFTLVRLPRSGRDPHRAAVFHEMKHVFSLRR
ncbi:hypothetical protein PQR68_23320 [Paraburkholderia agricolaris]|uniref:hypothetical protein n=1 Tax=Paraburkholderia agricolaris TaxID=2152888 RepID=UPI0038BD47CE